MNESVAERLKRIVEQSIRATEREWTQYVLPDFWDQYEQQSGSARIRLCHRWLRMYHTAAVERPLGYPF